MAETSGGNASPAPVQGPEEARLSGLKTMAIICYVLYLVAFISGFTALIGVIIAYIKKADAAGTVWESHFKSLILVFWVTLAVFVFGLVTFPVSLYSLSAFFDSGFVWPPFSALALPMLLWIAALPVLLIWYLYRTIRGLIRAAEDRAY